MAIFPLFFAAMAMPQEPPRDLQALLAAEPAKFASVLEHARDYRLQVLLAEPRVGADGNATLRRSTLGDPHQYFYPASAIKLAAAVAVQLELQRLQRERGVDLGADPAWRIAARFAGDADPAWIPIAADLRKMLVVSDNAAFNHCFELVGPRRLNELLWTAGFASCRVAHRLSESRTPIENRQTRAVSLRGSGGDLELPARDDPIDLDNSDWTDLDVGTAFLRDGVRIDGPMSFAHKNAILLRDLQDLLVAVVRPDIAIGKPGFPELDASAREQLVEWLTRKPADEPVRGNPVLCGVCRAVPKQHVVMREKSGGAYGFRIENCWVTDARTDRGFFLTAVLYVNPNGVLNDDDYAYQQIADPFFTDLGESVARTVFGDRGDVR